MYVCSARIIRVAVRYTHRCAGAAAFHRQRVLHGQLRVLSQSRFQYTYMVTLLMRLFGRLPFDTYHSLLLYWH